MKPAADKRILIVEDEPKVAEALRAGLVAEGYAATVANTGEDGFFLVSKEHFDLVLLDLNLPGRGGLEILATLRARGDETAFLIVTAKDTVEDRIAGLDVGADDYLVKPFAFGELLARVRALLRRPRAPEVTTSLNVADLEMDLLARQVRRAGRELDLTVREFELLEYLLRNAGQVVSREMLSREVWKETQRATPLDNVIDVHIARLRKKVDQDFATNLIHTLRGVGFVLREETP